jgi:SH3-like domain-containing protein
LRDIIGLAVLKCIRPHSGTRHFRVAAIVSPLVASAALIALTTLATQAGAQSVTTRDAELLAAPGSRPIATVRKGASVTTAASRGGYVQSTVEGWIAAPLLGAARDSFPRTVKAGGDVRLRSDPDAKAGVVAQLKGGMGLFEVERRGAWVRVRRSGWISSRAIGTSSVAAGAVADAQAPAAKASTAPAAAQSSVDTTVPPPAPTDTSRNGLVLTPVAPTSIATSPGGQRVGSLSPGARATVTARERGWVRVQVEGWMREADLSVADSALRGALSAADLRADPDGTVGRLVHWEVEILAHQIADPLRKGLVNQEPYLLAQGPAGENALLYLAIPPSLAATAREIPDLAHAIITARVRSGRSEPVGTPVLELLTIVGR